MIYNSNDMMYNNNIQTMCRRTNIIHVCECVSIGMVLTIPLNNVKC